MQGNTFSLNTDIFFNRSTACMKFSDNSLGMMHVEAKCARANSPGEKRIVHNR